MHTNLCALHNLYILNMHNMIFIPSVDLMLVPTQEHQGVSDEQRQVETIGISSYLQDVAAEVRLKDLRGNNAGAPPPLGPDSCGEKNTAWAHCVGTRTHTRFCFKSEPTWKRNPPVRF